MNYGHILKDTVGKEAWEKETKKKQEYIDEEYDAVPKINGIKNKRCVLSKGCTDTAHRIIRSKN